MRRFGRSAGAEDRGAVAVEAAFIVTLIVLPLVFGAISFGLIFAGNLAASNAARQGARAAIVNTPGGNDCAGVVNQVRQGLSGNIGIRYPVSVNVTTGGNARCTASIPSSAGAATYSSGSAAVIPCNGVGGGAGAQLVVLVNSTGNLFIPPYFFKTNYPIEGKGAFRCEFGS